MKHTDITVASYSHFFFILEVCKMANYRANQAAEARYHNVYLYIVRFVVINTRGLRTSPDMAKAIADMADKPCIGNRV